MRTTEPQIGDWIKPKGGALPGRGSEMGKIIGEGIVGGRLKMPAWKVDAGGGRVAVVPKDTMELWTKGDES